MKIEAHWSVIERHYIRSFNRPRLDLLLPVIAKKLMFKFYCDYKFLVSGAVKPYFWKAFTKEWKKCQVKEISNIYVTDHDQFMCSCPSRIRSQFSICKHLVNGKPLPIYRTVNIFHRPPFIVIEYNPCKNIINIDNELIGLEFGKVTISRSETAIASISNYKKKFTKFDLAFILNNSDSKNFTPITDEADESNEYNYYSSLKDTFGWFSNYLDKLNEKGGKEQLKYIHRTLLPRLQKFKENIERDENSRRCPRTWSHSDSVNNI